VPFTASRNAIFSVSLKKAGAQNQIFSGRVKGGRREFPALIVIPNALFDKQK